MSKLRLSDKEAKVLATVELNAELTIPEIRKLSGLREHTIRYALRRLEEREIISRSPFVNLTRLGYSLHNMFFSLSAGNRKQRDDLVKELIKTPEIVWVGQFGGDFQYAVDICVKDIKELQTVLFRMSERFGNILFQKAVSTQFAAHLLARGYLGRTKSTTTTLSFTREDKIVEIDELDKRILLALSEHGSTSHRQLATTLSIPLSTFELRIKKMRENKVLSGAFYHVRTETLGVSKFKLLVYARGLSSTLGARLKEFCSSHPHIISLYECFGAWDFEVGIEVFQPHDVSMITQSLFDIFGDELNNIQVLPQFGSLKFQLFPGNNV